MPTSMPASSCPVDSAGSRIRVEVVERGGVRSVLTAEAIVAGSVILEVTGVRVNTPSKYSVQVDERTHIDLPLVEALALDPVQHPWRFLNHSCQPNATLRGVKLVALRDLARGAEVTFDYNTTEYEMATPFTCGCGACSGSTIRGFKFLSAERQRDMYPRLADHLRQKVDGFGEG